MDDKILKKIYKIEAERVMWSYISEMLLTSGKPRFKNELFEKEMMKCWSKYRKLAAKNHRKALSKFSLCERIELNIPS